MALGKSPEECAERYLEVVHEHLSAQTVAEIRHGSSKGLPVGGSTFKRCIESETGASFGLRKLGRPRGDKNGV